MPYRQPHTFILADSTGSGDCLYNSLALNFYIEATRKTTQDGVYALDQFKDTAEYQEFLDQFASFHKEFIPKTWENFLTWCKHYTHPDDVESMLAPVLRKWYANKIMLEKKDRYFESFKGAIAYSVFTLLKARNEGETLSIEEIRSTCYGDFANITIQEKEILDQYVELFYDKITQSKNHKLQEPDVSFSEVKNFLHQHTEFNNASFFTFIWEDVWALLQHDFANTLRYTGDQELQSLADKLHLHAKMVKGNSSDFNEKKFKDLFADRKDVVSWPIIYFSLNPSLQHWQIFTDRPDYATLCNNRVKKHPLFLRENYMSYYNGHMGLPAPPPALVADVAPHTKSAPPPKKTLHQTNPSPSVPVVKSDSQPSSQPVKATTAKFLDSLKLQQEKKIYLTVKQTLQNYLNSASKHTKRLSESFTAFSEHYHHKRSILKKIFTPRYKKRLREHQLNGINKQLELFFQNPTSHSLEQLALHLEKTKQNIESESHRLGESSLKNFIVHIQNIIYQQVPQLENTILEKMEDKKTFPFAI